MKIGFTGTRRGMTDSQKTALRALLKSFQKESMAFECHHGDCVGADDEFANMAAEVYRCLTRIVCHPPANDIHRACNPRFNEMRPRKKYHDRNRDIVDETQVLIACPAEMTPQPRGGTWWTNNYAGQKGKPTYLILPDGTVNHSRPCEICGGRTALSDPMGEACCSACQ